MTTFSNMELKTMRFPSGVQPTDMLDAGHVRKADRGPAVRRHAVDGRGPVVVRGERDL